MMERIDNSLEGLVEEIPKGCLERDRSQYSKIKDSTTQYLVDVSAGWTFYTPIFATIEYCAGMEADEIKTSRLTAAAAHLFVMRPIGKLRNALATKWNVTKGSPWYQKLAVNACSVTPFQATAYAAVLAYSGASLKEMAVAFPTGVVTALILSEPMGKWMDIWRKIWGKEPAIKNSR